MHTPSQITQTVRPRQAKRLKRRNRSRFERDPKPPPMVITQQDHQVLRFLSAYGLLSQGQLERLLERSQTTVQRRLRRLYDHQFIERVYTPLNQGVSVPALYILDKRGIYELRRLGLTGRLRQFDKCPSAIFLAHTQAINEVRIAFNQASDQAGASLTRWDSERDLKADYDWVLITSESRPIPLVPDSYFKLSMPAKPATHFFLELDRGTMTLSRFGRKAAAYSAYYKQGGFTKRYAAHGFRVLTVVDGVGTKRVTNLCQAVARLPSVGRRFWFVHLEQIKGDNLLYQPIWQIAGQSGYYPLFSG